MPARATITIDLSKIEQNTRAVVSAMPGVEIVGVTKVACGDPRVARAMLAGGAIALGESRLENAMRLREDGITAPIWLIRAPVPALAEDAVRVSDVSVVSELSIAHALDVAAGRLGRRYGLLVMVEIGDLREGMMPDELPSFLEEVSRLANVDVIGVGASLTCYGAIVPDERNLALLASLADAAREQLGRPLCTSAGNSASIAAVLDGRAPAAVDNLRIGEAIVLGVDPVTREPINGLTLHRDAITLSAPVIECKVKPSKPIGTAAQDAFGKVPSFEDRGERPRALLALGRQDAPPEGLTPIDPRVEVLGASSDHLVLDVNALPQGPAIGESISFVPGYSATLALFTSAYVEKEYVGA